MVVGGYAAPTAPAGNAAGPLMASAGLTVSEYDLVAVRAPVSVAVIVIAKGLPVAVVGVPAIAPLLALMLSPVGRPVATHVYGPMPPAALIAVGGYADPTTPVSSVAGPVMLKAGLIASEYDLV